jgi:hypothetical protein
MKRVEHYRRFLGSFLLLLVTLLSRNVAAKPGDILMGKVEQTFPVLQTKTGAYTNVTVTKKTKDWIFILHSAGVCNVKASDLPTDARIALGYETPAPKGPAAEKPEGGVTTAETSAAAPAPKLPRFDFSQVKAFAADWRYNRKEKESEIKAFLAAHAAGVCEFLCLLLVFHILHSAIFWLICRKTHNAPGPLVWVPILQLIPLLRAANMPRVWFFAFFVPIINIIAIIVFSVKIVKSRGKGFWVSILLLVPPTSGLAMLYLAFSSSAPVEMANNEVLSLETA